MYASTNTHTRSACYTTLVTYTLIHTTSIYPSIHPPIHPSLSCIHIKSFLLSQLATQWRAHSSTHTQQHTHSIIYTTVRTQQVLVHINAQKSGFPPWNSSRYCCTFAVLTAFSKVTRMIWGASDKDNPPGTVISFQQRQFGAKQLTPGLQSVVWPDVWVKHSKERTAITLSVGCIFRQHSNVCSGTERKGHKCTGTEGKGHNC